MQLSNFFQLAVAGSIITTGGSLLALFIKDFLFTWYFEDIRDKKALDRVYKKYKDPIILSSIELSSRIIEILNTYPTAYLNRDVLNSTPSSLRKNTLDDEHFKKYKFISTLYRLCSFFGWLELYRQEITFLSSSNDKVNRDLEKCLLALRSVFADGHLNSSDDWLQWTDFLIFREEQRGIGERMIVNNDGTKSVMGYIRFKELVQGYIDSNQNDWIGAAIDFLTDFKLNKDFRKERLCYLLFHFKNLLKTIDKKQSRNVIERMDDCLIRNERLLPT